MPSLTTPIQHSIGSPSHSNQTRKRNKRNPNWKGGNQTVIVCRWHDSVHRKSYKLHQKTRPNKWIWQNSWIQSQYSEIKGITNNETAETEIRKKIPFNIATRKIKYLGINLMKEVKTCTQKTTQHWLKKLRKTQTNASMYHAHGLEEFTSSKWPYYPKQFVDSMQSLLEYQWHISQI